MKLSIIWRLSDREEKNLITGNSLQKQLEDYTGDIQLLIYKGNGQTFEETLTGKNLDISIYDINKIPENSNIFEDAKSHVTGDYVTFTDSGDRWSDGAFVRLVAELEMHNKSTVIMLKKCGPDGSVDAFAGDTTGKKVIDQVLRKKFHCHPFYFGGTILRTDKMNKLEFKNEYKQAMEQASMLDICAKEKNVLYISYITYLRDMDENQPYAKNQTDLFRTFWLPFLAELQTQYETVPVFIQYHLMHVLKGFIEQNMADCGFGETDPDREVVFSEIKQLLSYVEDDVMLNCYKLKETQVPDIVKMFYGKLKYDEEYVFEKKYFDAEAYYGSANTILDKISNLKLQIDQIKYRDGNLCVDGHVHPILAAMADQVYFMFGGKKKVFVYSGSYTGKEIMGQTMYQEAMIHVDMPFEDRKDCYLLCFANFGDESIRIPLGFDSAYVPISDPNVGIEWNLGGYSARSENDGIYFFKCSNQDKCQKEKLFEKKLGKARTQAAKENCRLRKMFYKETANKNNAVVLFMADTDQTESRITELYQYAVSEKDGNEYYFVSEPGSTVWKNLEAAGGRMVEKNSMQHKLLMLSADRLIVSTTDLKGYIPFDGEQMEYVRDLIHFDVVCIGEPGQGTDIVMERYRWETPIRFYFCTSEEQMLQMQRPEYGFYGRDILRYKEDISEIYSSIKPELNGEKKSEKIHLLPDQSEGLVDCKKTTEPDTTEHKEWESQVQEMVELAKENKVKPGRKNVTDAYYGRKIVPNTVALVGLGKGVRGSMQYILNELNSNDCFRDFKIYVRTDEETDATVQTYIKNNNWTRTQTIIKDAQYMEIIESAQYLLTEVYFPVGWVKKDGQTYINIWHGTPLKKLGLAKNANGKHKDGNTQKNFIEADYLLYPNEYTKVHMLESYKVATLIQGKALNLGYPRTGGMLAASKADLHELRAELAPNGEHLYAYMPTWKDYLEVEQVVAESKELLDYLDANLRDDQILYVNLHHKVSDSLDYSVYKRIKKFPPTVDSYQLLALTDALLTDYSSVFYDYLALRRQIILYCGDYKLYRKKRGTYMDLMELPFDKAKTKEEVLEAINRGKTYDDEAAYKEFCAYDSVDNAKKLCSLFTGTEEYVDVEPISDHAKKQVLIYSDSCGDSEDTRRLRTYIESDGHDDMDVFISCNRYLTNDNKDTAYPMLNNIPVIGTHDEYHLSGAGIAAQKLYDNKKITIEQAIQIWKYDYAAAGRRFYGHAPFDLILLYDVIDAQKLLSLTFMETPNKILCISDDMFRKLVVEKDQFLKDALKVCLPYMRGVFVKTEEQRMIFKAIYGDAYAVQLITNEKDLKNLIALAVRDEGE